MEGHSRGCDPEQCDKFKRKLRARGRKAKVGKEGTNDTAGIFAEP
jgi:hypothetical protein